MVVMGTTMKEIHVCLFFKLKIHPSLTSDIPMSSELIMGRILRFMCMVHAMMLKRHISWNNWKMSLTAEIILVFPSACRGLEVIAFYPGGEFERWLKLGCVEKILLLH